MQLDIKKKSTKQKQKQMKPLESTPPKQNEVEFPFMLYLPLYIFSKIVENTVCLTPNDLHILISEAVQDFDVQIDVALRTLMIDWCTAATQVKNPTISSSSHQFLPWLGQ